MWDRFAQALFYYAGDPADAAIYPGLDAYVRDVERDRGTGGNRLFYVSTPPSLYPHLVARLGEAEPLSALTRGVHLHTVEASRDGAIDEARQALRALGILLEGPP